MQPLPQLSESGWQEPESGGKLMKSIKGPGIFLAQFAGDTAPFNSFDAICKWASSLGYEGVQIPTWDARLFDLKKASDSKTYCDELSGVWHSTDWRSPSCPLISRGSSSRSTLPMMLPSMALRRLKCAATRRHAPDGRSTR
jgi:hypothetical protein